MIDSTEWYVGEPPSQLRCRTHRLPDREAVPVIMIHGGSQTSECWTHTPDGRPGWAAQFLDRGYEVTLVDYIDIGREYPKLDRGPEEVLDGIGLILQETGPAVVVGHSIGGALGIKAVERWPGLVRSVVLAAPAPVEVRNPDVLEAAPGVLVKMSREVARHHVAGSPRFPDEWFDTWYAGIVSYSPVLRNAGAGVTGELRIDPAKTGVWRTTPTLFVLAEHDRTVSVSAGRATARAIGVEPVRLDHDWGLPGHGHMFILEEGSESIADRVLDWLQSVTHGEKVTAK
ncbi:alpha/beta fold hydrolase [Tsukamurella sp. NPDC003166]|uniref:alpha/beta fold hydrolase n=1 Tax=Tsukamurella sp. NPDC003166 TaxID=3154444 RepID=UPI0033BE31EA